MVRRPTFTALKALESLIRCGSLQKAADDLHVSPGAVSQQIRLLETELGLKLFDRSGRAMKPVQEATVLAGVISGAFDTIYQAVDRLSETKRKIQLKIATLPSIATRVVLPRLDELRKCLPDVQLNFTYVHRLEDIHFWDADVLICAVDKEFAGKGHAHLLFSGAVRPFASADYLERNGPFAAPSDIKRAKLLHDFDAKAWRSWYERARINPPYSTDGDVFEDFELLIHAALAHQGIALCPPTLISQEIETRRLLPVFDLSVLENRNYVVVVPERGKEEAAVFASWLVSSTSGSGSEV
ncbi:LysR family transcriptional regulator [Pelagibius sp.]|uniref:LysR family transcriptional regulator n=1 Tax=Pelagibius sp. TaxID=1931238 RepID=UPI003B514A74